MFSKKIYKQDKKQHNHKPIGASTTPKETKEKRGGNRQRKQETYLPQCGKLTGAAVYKGIKKAKKESNYRANRREAKTNRAKQRNQTKQACTQTTTKDTGRTQQALTLGSAAACHSSQLARLDHLHKRASKHAYVGMTVQATSKMTQQQLQQ